MQRSKPKPFGLQVQLAVLESDMDRELRHLVLTLAILADNETGESIKGQATIAAAMGASERHVRGLMARLEQADSTPVRLERTARFKEGRGRTSDRWRLVFADSTNRQTVPVEPATNRNSLPVEGDGLTGTPRTTNRQTTHDQPAQCAGDLLGDLRSDLRGTFALASEGDVSTPKTRERKPSQSKPVNPLAQPLKDHYIAELKRLRQVEAQFPSSGWSRAMKALGELGATFGLERGREIITKALGDSFRRRVSPWELVTDATNILASQSPQRTPEPQRGITTGRKPARF